MNAQRDIRLGPFRGLNREQAAAYMGVGTTKFDQMVADGRAPKAKRIDGRLVWDIRRLDSAFDNLPDDGPRPQNTADAACGFGSQTGPAT